MDRRSFIGTGAIAAAGVCLDGALARALAQTAKGTPGAIATTTAGKVRGLLVDTVYAFRGITYGASTAGARRFLPPLTPQPWTGVADAFELGHRSPLVDSVLVPEWRSLNLREPMGEDCLNLNVWTRGLDAAGKRPVMAWLHGGGYGAGSPGMIPYDGANLARKRVGVHGAARSETESGRRSAEAADGGPHRRTAAAKWTRTRRARRWRLHCVAGRRRHVFAARRVQSGRDRHLGERAAAHRIDRD